jgi:hypothetical protein
MQFLKFLKSPAILLSCFIALKMGWLQAPAATHVAFYSPPQSAYVNVEASNLGIHVCLQHHAR